MTYADWAVVALVLAGAALVGLWFRPRRARRLDWVIGPVEFVERSHFHKETDMALILTDEQKVTLTLAPKTAAGNPARVDGVPVWSVSDEAILTLEVAEDGLSAVATTTGTLGNCQVAAVADADLDDDEIREIAAVLDVEVRAAEAVLLGIEAGAPESK